MKPVRPKATARLPVCRSVRLSLAPRNAAPMVVAVVVAIVFKAQPVMDCRVFPSVCPSAFLSNADRMVAADIVASAPLGSCVLTKVSVLRRAYPIAPAPNVVQMGVAVSVDCVLPTPPVSWESALVI